MTEEKKCSATQFNLLAVSRLAAEHFRNLCSGKHHITICLMVPHPLDTFSASTKRLLDTTKVPSYQSATPVQDIYHLSGKTLPLKSKDATTAVADSEKVALHMLSPILASFSPHPFSISPLAEIPPPSYH